MTPRRKRLLAVVAIIAGVGSATALATSGNTSIALMTWSARLAAARARSFGQPCTGFTSRSRVRPKLAIARAAVPTFSPSCGSTRMITGERAEVSDMAWF